MQPTLPWNLEQSTRSAHSVKLVSQFSKHLSFQSPSCTKSIRRCTLTRKKKKKKAVIHKANSKTLTTAHISEYYEQQVVLHATKAKRSITSWLSWRDGRSESDTVSPDPSQESHSLSLSNPQIWGYHETEVPGTLSPSCASGIGSHSPPAWILHWSSRKRK